MFASLQHTHKATAVHRLHHRYHVRTDINVDAKLITIWGSKQPEWWIFCQRPLRETRASTRHQGVVLRHVVNEEPTFSLSDGCTALIIRGQPHCLYKTLTSIVKQDPYASSDESRIPVVHVSPVPSTLRLIVDHFTEQFPKFQIFRKNIHGLFSRECRNTSLPFN